MNHHPLRELALLFLKLGVIGFGGPAVHIAMMEVEVVTRRKWISSQEFLDLVGATNLIPGPNSTEMAMHIGLLRGGWKGLVIAGLCFIMPAVLITGTIAWAYQKWGSLPQVQPFIYGIKPAIIAVITVTVWRLGIKSVKSATLFLLGLLALVLVLLGASEIAVLFGAGIAGMILRAVKGGTKAITGIFPLPLLQVVSTAVMKTGAMPVFWIFLKIGSILYGSGYVLFAFLDEALVDKGLITKQQLLDAVAVGQFTPGPVFSSATFIGWQMGGFDAAAGATIGIFLPSFLFVALLNPLIPMLRRSKLMSAFLEAVTVASIAIIFSLMVVMARGSVTDWRTITIALAGLVCTAIFPKLNTAFIVAGGALAGYLLYQL